MLWLSGKQMFSIFIISKLYKYPFSCMTVNAGQFIYSWSKGVRNVVLQMADEKTINGKFLTKMKAKQSYSQNQETAEISMVYKLKEWSGEFDTHRIYLWQKELWEAMDGLLNENRLWNSNEKWKRQTLLRALWNLMSQLSPRSSTDTTPRMRRYRFEALRLKVLLYGCSRVMRGYL